MVYNLDTSNTETKSNLVVHFMLFHRKNLCLKVAAIQLLSIIWFGTWAELFAVQETQVHFGNGVHNGWVDQTSAVIWTRTTATPGNNWDGPDFLVPNKPAFIEGSGNSKLQLSSQLPEGGNLNEMLGACPGIASKVTLFWRIADAKIQFQSAGERTTTGANDFCAQWKLTGLKPGTQYEIRLVAAGDKASEISGHFQTATDPTEIKPFGFCMTTCHDFVRRDDNKRGHKIYSAMTKLNPDFMVHAGDIEYYDKPKPFAWTIPLMRFHWNRIFALPANRDFFANHTTYFMKDDHDTLKDDCWPGQTYGSVSFEEGRRLFAEEQFPSNELPFKTIRWGRDIQIWLLEGRDFRTPNKQADGPEKTILGNRQKNWLCETLAASNARFKLVFSPTPIVGPDRANKNDNLANSGFSHESSELRHFFATQPGVIVLCGDRHWQYASRDSETGLWEFGCGPGSEHHELGWKKGDVRPEHEFLRVAGGFLSGEITYEGDTPKLALRHHSVDGAIVNEISDIIK